MNGSCSIKFDMIKYESNNWFISILWRKMVFWDFGVISSHNVFLILKIEPADNSGTVEEKDWINLQQSLVILPANTCVCILWAIVYQLLWASSLIICQHQLIVDGSGTVLPISLSSLQNPVFRLKTRIQRVSPRSVWWCGDSR